jgi:hypothetical protein
MKNIAIGFLTVLLCAAPSGHVQRITDVPAMNNGAMLSTVEVGTNKPCPSVAGSLGEKAQQGKIKPMSVLDDTENCDSLQDKVINYSGAQEWQQCFDTAKQFIETCYNNWYSPYMFNYISASLQPLATADSSLWLQARQWLESVLYLNTTNPEYFCACVKAIQGTFNSPSDTSETLYWDEQNRAFAIEEWMIQNTTCDTPLTVQEALADLRDEQYEDWLNNTSVPWDTTIPPLDSLGGGLDTILAKHLLYASVSNPPQPGIISNAAANPNPANSGTVISFSIGKEAYVKIELFDVLGHEVSSYDYESLFEPGNKSVSFSLASLPSGTYFARIMTAYGEVQSVKIVKE